MRGLVTANVRAHRPGAARDDATRARRIPISPAQQAVPIEAFVTRIRHRDWMGAFNDLCFEMGQSAMADRGPRGVAIFRTLAPYMSDEDYWRCLRIFLPVIEDAPDDVRSLLRARRATRTALLMTRAERERLAALPFYAPNVYRGCREERGRLGFLWDFDWRMAQWRAGGGPILSGTVTRARIIALFLEWETGFEVVADPRHVRDQKLLT
jgi:hypothetical protein